MRWVLWVVLFIMVVIRWYGVFGVIWEFCVFNCCIVRVGNYYFIFLERRVFWNIDL